MAVVVLVGGLAQGQEVVIQTVPVGNPGNAGELSGTSACAGLGFGPDAIVGSVSYTYSIGKYEVTAGQYCEFLNAVAKTDTCGVYKTSMWNSPQGCKIERSGTSGSYSYSVAVDRANRPVNVVSWGDAARFCNWLSNGQPTGGQGTATTEDGSYYLDGATSQQALMAVTRKPGATWVIPTEDEWYQAAYYNGSAGVYYDYPTGSNTMPDGIDFAGDTTFDAVFWDYGYSEEYANAVTNAGVANPYSTIGQGGNIGERNETAIHAGSSRGKRGGDWLYDIYGLMSCYRGSSYPNTGYTNVGFRVASVPEPSSLVIFAIGGHLVRRLDVATATVA